MKELIKEAQRFQELAGIVKENEQNIAEFCNTHFKELEAIFGKIPTEFELETLENGMELASAGTDYDNGITISFDPEFVELGDVYNEIEDVEVAGRTIYVNNYLLPEDEDEDEDDDM